MIIIMTPGSGPRAMAEVLRKAEELGFGGEVVERGFQPAILVRDCKELKDLRTLQELPGVERVIPLSPVSGLVSKELKPDPTIVRLGDVDIGAGKASLIAGPCAVESFDQVMRIAELVVGCGVEIFRAGAFKPRTSPYSFQGLGEEGLDILARVREETGLKIVTEALDCDSLGMVNQYADMVQIGSRNMQNYLLLKAAGRLKKPVLLKRGMAATLEEWLMAAEYILAEGNEEVLLCERGVRTFSDHARFTLDLGVVPAIRDVTHLPVIVDPSHGTGLWSRVPPMAKAAIAAGADGVMLEVHHQPDKALSDGAQSLDPDSFVELISDLKRLADALGIEM